MKKETTAKKTADLEKELTSLRASLQGYVTYHDHAQIALLVSEQKYNALRSKNTLALLKLESERNMQRRCVRDCAEAKSALAEERLRHQATKRLIPAVAFFSGMLGVVMLALYMWATRWTP